METVYASILFPLTFLFSFHNKVKLNFLTFYVFLCFSDGLIQILLPTRFFTVYKIVILAFIFLIVVRTSFKSRDFIKQNTPGLSLFSIFLISLVFVIIINNNSVSSLITFIRVPLMGYLFFIIMFNYNMKSDSVNELLLLIKRLLIIQIFAAVLKYFLLGMAEKPVTTISAMGGSSAVLLPVMMAIIVLALYLFYNKDKKLFLLLPLILLIGFINSKRGIWIFLPALLVLTYSVWQILRYGWGKSLRYLTVKLPFILILGLLIFYIGVRMNRTLNPDRKVWGRFDLEYASNYIREYNYDEDYYEDTKLVKGRQAGLEYTLVRFLSDQPIITALFGIGPDKIIAQQHQSYEIRSTGIESRGSMTGLVQYMWATGILPVIIYLLFIVQLLRFSFRSYSRLKASNYEFFPFTAIMFCFVFFIDFIFYTTAFINILALQVLFYSSIAISSYVPERGSFGKDRMHILKVLLREI